MTNKDIKKWFEDNKIISIEILDPDNSYFSHTGCDTDPERLGNNTYDCTLTTDDGTEFAADLSQQAITWFLNRD